MSGKLVVRRKLGECNRGDRCVRSVEFGIMSEFTRQIPQGSLVLQNGCECNRLMSCLARRLTHKFKDLPPDLSTEEDRNAYLSTDEDFIKWWRKFTNSRPLSADDLLAVKEGRTSKLIEHCGHLGVPVRSGNVQKYRRQHWLFRDRGFDTSVTVLPPVSWMHKRSWIQDFPKVEFLVEGKYTRAISPPDPGWNFVMSQFSCAAEKNFYSIMNRDVNSEIAKWFPFSCGPLVGKSYNSLERGQILKRKWDTLEQRTGKKVVCSSTDCEGFDAHHRKYFIDAEGKLMARMFVQHKRWIEKVWKDVSKSHGGNEYYTWETEGGRDSGHPWTGWGNCYAIIKLLKRVNERFFARYGYMPAIDVFSDGDDCLILMTEDVYEIYTQVVRETFAVAGHVVKFEQKANTIFEVVWCQSKIIEVEDDQGSPAFKFVHNPFKMLKVLGSTLNMNSAQEAESYIGDILYAYSVLNQGIPLYKDLVRVCPPQHKHQLSPESGLVLELSKEGRSKYTVTQRTYQTFCEAWNCKGLVEAIEAEIAVVESTQLGWVTDCYSSQTNHTKRAINSIALNFFGRLRNVIKSIF